MLNEYHKLSNLDIQKKELKEIITIFWKPLFCKNSEELKEILFKKYFQKISKLSECL